MDPILSLFLPGGGHEAGEDLNSQGVNPQGLGPASLGSGSQAQDGQGSPGLPPRGGAQVSNPSVGVLGGGAVSTPGIGSPPPAVPQARPAVDAQGVGPYSEGGMLPGWLQTLGSAFEATKPLPAAYRDAAVDQLPAAGAAIGAPLGPVGAALGATGGSFVRQMARAGLGQSGASTASGVLGEGLKEGAAQGIASQVPFVAGGLKGMALRSAAEAGESELASAARSELAGVAKNHSINWDISPETIKKESGYGRAVVHVPIDDVLEAAKADINRPGRARQAVEGGGDKLTRAKSFLQSDPANVQTPELGVENGKLTIEDGYHRLQAARDAGWRTAPVRIDRSNMGTLRKLGVDYRPAGEAGAGPPPAMPKTQAPPLDTSQLKPYVTKQGVNPYLDE